MSGRSPDGVRIAAMVLTLIVLALAGVGVDISPVGTAAAACSVPATGGTSNTTFTADDGTAYRIEAFEAVGADALDVCANVTVDVLVVGGGGSSNAEHSGGGGAGGVVFEESIALQPGSYPITVGAGGAAVPNERPADGGNNGENSSALGFVAIGGGSSGSYDHEGAAEDAGKAGGSGGGAGGGDAEDVVGAALQPDSASGGFGHPGGRGLNDPHYLGGGGGGADAAGSDATADAGGDGGAGLDLSASFGTTYGEEGVFAGGGGGAGNEVYYGSATYGVGGLGGGGNASGQAILGDDSSWVYAEDGMPNTGGGGGGVARHEARDKNNVGLTTAADSASGGSGVVLIRYVLPVAPQLDANRSTTTFRPSTGAAVVAPQLTIADPTGTTIDGARVSITANLSATDVLGYSDAACGGLTCDYNPTTGILAISGDADASTYQAVLRSVTYNDTDPGADEPPRTIAFSLGAAGNYFPATGHYYEVVTPGTAVTWEAANTSASTRDYFGLQGYLVTITDQAESTYITSKLAGVSGWLGASDEATEGAWRWMGGPEAGQQFWEGAAAGSTVGGRFANWNDGEPNDASGEDYAQFLADGRWNDLPASSALDSYVVEYGGSAGDPTLQLSDEVTVSHLQLPPRFGAAPSVATAFANRTTGTVHAVENSTTLTFTAPGVTDPEGDAVTISWDFGDNSTATGATVTHTYGDVISAYEGSRTYTPTVSISDGQRTNTSATLPTVTVHGDVDGDGLADADGLTEVLTDGDDDGDGIADVDDSAPAVATLGTLRGTVTTAAGQPPTGGSITAVSPTFAYRNTTSLAADGTYTLDLPVGSYTVTITPTAGAPTRFDSTVRAGETTTADRTLAPSGTLLVSVTDSTGTPQTGVHVTAAREATRKHATTNDTGVAHLMPAPGRYIVDVFADGAGASAETVTVTADTTTTLAVQTSPQTVLHTAVRITEGAGSTTLDGDAIVPVASVSDGLLQVQLVDDGEAGRDTSTIGSPADLSRYGVDASTRFAIDLTVTNYTPSSLLWAIRDPTLSVTANGTTPGATDVTVTGAPVTMAVTTAGGQGSGPLVGADPATVAWPAGADDHAATLYNQTVIFVLYDLSLMEADRREALDGLSVTTNAQRFSIPAVTDESKRIWVGGPGFRPGGTQHTGFYQVTLPPAQLSAWGITDADQQLRLEQANTTRSTTLQRVGEAIRLTATDISYSASFVELRRSVSPGPAVQTQSDGATDRDDEPAAEPSPVPATPAQEQRASVPAPAPAPAPVADSAVGRSGGSGGVGTAIAQAVTAPIVWFGELEPAEQAVVATGGAGAAGGAAYALGGDRVQTPINLAQRYARRRLTIRLRGSTRSRLMGMIRNRGRGFSWRRLLERLRRLRRFLTRSYWRRRREETRQLLTREGLSDAVRARVREVRTRQWRKWLRGQLRALVDQVIGGGPIGMGVSVVGGPVSALISLITSEARRWVEDVVMDRIDAVRRRSAAVIVRSNSWLRRLWRRVDPPDTVDVRGLAALSVLEPAQRHALEEVGITDVGQLSEADPDRLATALEVDPERTEAWKRAAEEHIA